MKIYSEKTNKNYATVEECLEAEKQFDEKVAAEKAKKEELASIRKARAVEVEDAYKAVVEAQKKYNNLLKEFLKDYNSYHMTISDNSNIIDPFNWMNEFFNFFK